MKLLVLSDLHLEFCGQQPGRMCLSCGDKFRRAAWKQSFSCNVGHCDVCGRDDVEVTTADNCGYLRAWNLKLPAPDAYDERRRRFLLC